MFKSQSENKNFNFTAQSKKLIYKKDKKQKAPQSTWFKKIKNQLGTQRTQGAAVASKNYPVERNFEQLQA